MPPTINDFFPPTAREFYEKAPLIQVICQFRFPRLLSIEAQPPAPFQERIRRTFPLFEQGAASSLPQMPALPPEVMQFLGTQITGARYQFSTEDQNSTVTLTSETLSYSTKVYTQWEEFRARFEEPLGAFIELYTPPFFSRVGLRYVDVINREALGLRDRPWSQLIRLGQFAFPEFEPNVESATHLIVVNLPDQRGSVTLRHGFAHMPGKSGISYLIDFDFYRSQKTEIKDALPTFDGFHELAGRAFRRCITDVLRAALGPTPLDEHGIKRPIATSDAAH
jgi:uncharacterized protein (TIGR04255 family)